MNENALHPGDTVRLKCGGPRMVIADRARKPPKIPGVLDLQVHPTGWRVLWTIQNALREAVIPEVALEKVPAGETDCGVAGQAVSDGT